MKKTMIGVAGAILLLLVAACGIFIYRTRYETSTLDVAASPDGDYALTLSSVGEPDWPFGRAYGRITLTEDGEQLSKTEIDLAEDGCQISKNNWRVVWQDAYAEVTLHASEQPDELWHIYFDGRIEQLR